jgi:hypothetical protein
LLAREVQCIPTNNAVNGRSKPVLDHLLQFDQGLSVTLANTEAKEAPEIDNQQL